MMPDTPYHPTRSPKTVDEAAESKRETIFKYSLILILIKIIVTVFVTKYGIMLVLPYVMEYFSPRWEPIFEDVGLVVIISPVIYLLIIRPLKKDIAFKTNDLISAADLLSENELNLRSALVELEDQRKALDEHAAVTITDVSGNIIYVNDRMVEISGYSRDELLGRNHRFVKSGVHTAEFYHDLWETIVHGGIWKGEICNRRKDGTLYWAHATIVPFGNADGRIEKYVAVKADITAGKNASEAVRRSKERYELAVKGSRDALWDWNLKTNEVYYAPRWAEMLGIDLSEIEPTPAFWCRFILPDELSRFHEKLARYIEGSTDQFEFEMQMRRKSGEPIWVLCRGSVVRGEAGRAIRLAGFLADITELKTAQAVLQEAAETDALTGLPNRTRFKSQLRRTISRSNRDHSKFAILFFDFDRFKVINDSLGHDVGDALLIDIAEIFRRELRESDAAARFGGDEFVVLVDPIEHFSGAHEVASRLLEIFSRPRQIGEHQIDSKASIGLVTNEFEYTNADDMIRDADVAMYEAKAAGRGQFVCFDRRMHKKVMQRLALERDLRNAVGNDQLRLLFQPIISLETGQAVGLEALIRLAHPDGGFIEPDDFIGLAEDTGLIVPIGQWVMQNACRQVAAWNRTLQLDRRISVNVNVSKRQLLRSEFVDETLACVSETGVQPSDIKIEITETTIVDNRCDMIPMLQALRNHGIKIVMDDFGTGHSSLSGLHRFPIDILKIDKSFCKEMSGNRDLIAVVSSIITLASHLDIETVAEGVVNSEQLVALQSVSCMMGQGYYFSKPLAPAAAERFLLGIDDQAQSA